MNNTIKNHNSAVSTHTIQKNNQLIKHLAMAEEQHFGVHAWSKAQTLCLLKNLVSGSFNAKLNDTYTFGYFITAIARNLSLASGQVISRENVLKQIIYLKDRYMNFKWFMCLPGVSYDENTNTTIVTDAYYEGGAVVILLGSPLVSFFYIITTCVLFIFLKFVTHETPWKFQYMTKGEHWYKDLKIIFEHRLVDEADFDWLRTSFALNRDNLHLPAYGKPQKNWGLTAGLGRGGHGGSGV